MKLLVHIEQYNVVGILPSQLESIMSLCHSLGIMDCAYVDSTPDGIIGIGGFTRYSNIEEFFENESGPYICLSPTEGTDIRTLSPDPDTWLLFGPAMGFQDILNELQTHNVTWANIPIGDMNSRDAVPIVLWELSSWRE
jgi:hypothetical protein